MKVEDYSKAATELIADGKSVDEVLQNLQTLLKAHGALKQYPAILNQMLHDSEALAKADEAIIRIKSEDDLKRYREALKYAIHDLGGASDEHIIEDNTIIGGYSVSVRGRTIDNTYKRRLTNLYRAIIK